MKKGKLTALVLAALTAASVFAGCGNEPSAPSGGPSGAGAGSGTPAESSATAQAHKLSIMGTEGWAPCTNWNEVTEYSAWKILQSWLDEAGLDISWEVIAAEQYDVVMQTRLSSGTQLPDIFKASASMDNAALLALAKQGIIQPIDEAVEQYSNGNIKKAFHEDYKNVIPLTTAEDGRMYWFPNVQTKYYGDQSDVDGTFTILYRKDWADALGLAAPADIAEFKKMFQAFRDGDANGNGKADEILFIDLSTFRTAIAQWFDLVPGSIGIDPYGKKVVSAWHNPNAAAYFTFLNELVQAGIIDPSVAGNYEMLTQKLAENKIAGMWDYANAAWNEPQVEAAAPDVLYAPLMPVAAVDGVVPAGMSEPGALVWEKFAVTRECRDMEAVIKLMDLVYTDEYGMLTAFGEEGKNFTMVDGVITPVEGLTGDSARDQRISEGAMLWNGVLPRVQKVDMRQQVAGKDEFKTKVTLDMIGYGKKYPDQLDNFLAIPTAEESARINELLTNVNTASSELSTKLALGQIPIGQLEAEVAKLDAMGLSELLEITQARYDRYLAKLPK